MANIDIILETGLINDYGVFNLNKEQLENLNVDVVTDGNQFVESEEAKYQHGGESNFKDHEGIKPIDLKEGEKAKWDQYGTILNNELKKYIEIPENNDDWVIHPLPLLCADGNGLGGGDYYGINMDKVGIWAYDRLGVTNKRPHYKKIKVEFKEKY